MTNTHIRETAITMLGSLQGYTTSYVRAVLNEALQRLDKYSVYLPFEEPRKEAEPEGAFTADVVRAIERLRPEWFGEGSSLSDCLEQAQLAESQQAESQK